MTFCANCGAAAAAGARFCGACGAAVAPAAGAGTGAGTRDTGTAQALILGGALLGGAMFAFAGLVVVAVMLFVGSARMPSMDWDMWPLSAADAAFTFVGFIGVLVAAVGLGWMGLALHARTLVRRGRLAEGSVVAIVAGGLMIVIGLFAALLPSLAGALVLAGGLLARPRAEL